MPLKPKSLTTQTSNLALTKHTLSKRDLGLMIQYRADGLSTTKIAQRLGVSHSAISQQLAQYTDDRDLTRLRAQAATGELWQDVREGTRLAALAGRPEPAIRLLEKLEVLPKDQVADQRSAIQIVIGMPGKPAGPDPMIALPPADDAA